MRYWLPACVVLTAAVTYAQSHLPTREMSVVWARGAPQVSFSAKDLVDDHVRRELSSGLQKRIAVSVSAHLRGSNRRLADRSFGCDVTKDLWDDQYMVRIGSRSVRFKTLPEVLDHCLEVRGLFVGGPDRYERDKGREIYLFVRVEFNPISKEQCKELIRPSAGGDPVGPITMSIVRRRICQAERSLEFRSEFEKVPQ